MSQATIIPVHQKRKRTADELEIENERLTRRCRNQGRELRRLNAKITAVTNGARVMEARFMGDPSVVWCSRGELAHDVERWMRRAREAEHELARLREAASK